MSGQPDVRGPGPLRSSRPMPSSIIVVDDDPVFRDLARRVLAGQGLVVVAESDSIATALDLVHALRPDAALVDLGLPDGDGVIQEWESRERSYHIRGCGRP